MARLALVAGVVAAVAAGAPAGWQQWQRFQASRPVVPPAPVAAPATPDSAAPPPQTTKPLTATTPTTAPSVSTPQTPATSQLLLRSNQPSWLEVKQAGGKSLFRGTFEGERSFPLGSGLKVLAGRPDLVQAQLGNEPAKPLGRIDQVRWQRFTVPAP